MRGAARGANEGGTTTNPFVLRRAGFLHAGYEATRPMTTTPRTEMAPRYEAASVEHQI
jgi:hypothetical protein